jgi:hypothetical protein
MMRLYRMERREGWLIRVEASFARAVSLVKELPEAYLELGEAYKHAYRLLKAEEAYNMVLKINTVFLSEALEELETLKKIEMAAPATALGKELVLQKTISRGEAAGLITRETELVPTLSRNKRQGAGASPPDLTGHPMKDDITAVTGLNLQGLSVLHDGSFGPDQPMTRAAFATLMADILVRVTGRPDLYQRYEGVDSPYLDVRENSPYFTSIMICSEWAGIMRGWDGCFFPMEAISGFDALLVLREAEKKEKRKS